MSHFDLQTELGGIDIYLLDQVLKGRFPPGTRILDAGCGHGRNLVYFLRQGYEVMGLDRDPAAVAAVRRLATDCGQGETADARFLVADVTDLPFGAASFDAVVCNAVLHFAGDEAELEAMLRSLWRVLAPGGLFFARLASSIGIEHLVTPIEGRRHRLPDGSTRFLVDEAMLLALTEELGGRLLEPIKTVNVQNQRCMTTWVATRADPTDRA